MFPNCKNVFVNAKTTLPTKEDHNYVFYTDNFRRVIGEHFKKVDLYKMNHPDFKTIFLLWTSHRLISLQEKRMRNQKKER